MFCSPKKGLPLTSEICWRKKVQTVVCGYATNNLYIRDYSNPCLNIQYLLFSSSLDCPCRLKWSFIKVFFILFCWMASIFLELLCIPGSVFLFNFLMIWISNSEFERNELLFVFYKVHQRFSISKITKCWSFAWLMKNC